MYTSGFGVEHWETSELVSKKDKEKSYGRQANTLAGLGATTAGLGTGSKIVGRMEDKGKDPMGFVSIRESPNAKKIRPEVRARVLAGNAAAHHTQAKVAAGLTAGSLALAGGYKYAQKKERQKKLSKALKPETKRKARDAALDAGTVGVSGASIAGAGAMGRSLAPAVKAHAPNAYWSHRAIKEHESGKYKVGPRTLANFKNNRKVSGRVAGVKGAGTLAAAGIAGLGGKSIYDVGARRVKDRKKS